MYKHILNLFPEHKTYVEGFGGAGHVIFSKKPSGVDVYNDIHEGLYNLFKVLRDKELSQELIYRLQLTPYSRKEYEDCRDSWRYEEDDVEKARKFYTSVIQSFNCLGRTWKYSKTIHRKGMSQTVSSWLNKIDNKMIDIVERSREIQIENKDILDLIDTYDNKDTLFYLDPPYVPETRKNKKAYKYELSADDHVKLVNRILNIEGKVILSGYENDIYKKLEENGWSKILLGEYHIKSAGKNNKKGKEFIWINYSISDISNKKYA